MSPLLDLFMSFSKIGMFTFGGGYAMISIIEDICVNKKKWITHEDMMNITVIAESTPGPVAINCATFVGYKKAGFKGAFASTIGVIIPSFIIIYLISMFLKSFLEIEMVAKAFSGIKIAVGILILNAAINMIKKMKKDVMSVVFLVCACAIMLVINFLSLNISTIIFMLAAAVLGIAAKAVKGFSEHGDNIR